MAASQSYKISLILAFLSLLLQQSDSAPAQLTKDRNAYDEIEKINQKSTEKFFEGDIVPNWFEKEVVDGKYRDTVKRDAQRAREYLWRTRIIPYEIAAGDYQSYERDTIKNALKIFENKTCLKFPQRTNETSWIIFRKLDGCYSSVGKDFWRTGSQTISLARGCVSKTTILHEVMHALGFWHEQSRPDRDSFVEILWENIEPSHMHNFKRYSHLAADVLGVDYDYDTIMHYGTNAFSKNSKPTIKAIGNENRELGRSMTLSASDITQINALYDCANKDVSYWSTWSGYSPCDSNCYKRRQRFCSHSDATKCPNTNAFGIAEELLACTDAECYAPVDGNWGRWSPWGPCNRDCGAGKGNRTRKCNDPAPKYGGKPCNGDTISYQDCFIKNCGLGDLDCEFDGQGWCFWKNDPQSTFKWKRIQGATPSQYTGPSTDHTSGSGNYLYIESSAPAKAGDKARMISKELTATDSICMSFWYHMYGSAMGNLRVFTRSSNGVEQEIWQQSGNKGNKWLSANKTISSSTPFKVIFEAEVGSGFLSDVSLDDVMFKNRKCEKSAIELKCGVAMKSIGCFAESSGSRILPKLLDTHRDASTGHQAYVIDWNNYPKSIEIMLCHCAQKAKSKGYKYFGLQYYAECWSGPGEISYNKYGASKECVDEKYQECSTVKDQPCSGKSSTNYIYQLL